MQKLRLPPYPLSLTYDVPLPDTSYKIYIKDSERDYLWAEYEATSDASSKLTFTLSDDFDRFDDEYSLEIHEDGDHLDPFIVVEDNLEILRPYVDPKTLGTTASEISQYTYWEGLARAIIDSVVPGGFYYERTWYEPVGNNTDFMPVWDRTYSILQAYENNKLVWDINQEPQALENWNYLLTKDKTAIIKDWVQEQDSYIRQVGNPKGVPLSESDSYYLYDTEDSAVTFAVAPGVTFPMGWNYLFSLATGYKVVPYDIKDATLMLIDDLKCGRLDYHKRYITSYATDQYRIQIDKSSLEGTGNILVDKILQKYITNFGTPGVL
jgi:hypothetical protein